MHHMNKLFISRLYGQAIAIFPFPSTEDSELTEQYDLLLKLYNEVDTKDLQHLELLMPGMCTSTNHVAGY